MFLCVAGFSSFHLLCIFSHNKSPSLRKHFHLKMVLSLFFKFKLSSGVWGLVYASSENHSQPWQQTLPNHRQTKGNHQPSLEGESRAPGSCLRSHKCISHALGLAGVHSQGPDRPHYWCVFLYQGALPSFFSWTPALVTLPFCRFFHPLIDSLSLGKATELYVRGTNTAQATHLQRLLWSPCVHTLTPPSHMHMLSLVLFPTLAFWGAATGLCSQNCQDPLLAIPRVGADCCIHHVGHSFSKPACSGREGSGSEKHKYRGPALPSPYTLLPHKPHEIFHQNKISHPPHARLPTNGNQKIGAILGPPFSPYLCQCPRYRFPIFLYCNILER